MALPLSILYMAQDKGPPKGFSFGAGVDGAVGGGNVSGQNDSSTFTNANDPLKV